MKRFLFLDDSAHRHEGFDKICQNLDVEVTHAWTDLEACRALCMGPVFDCVFLDHDLDETCQGTGMNVALFIADHMPTQCWPRKVVIHSWNPAGATNMFNALFPTGIPVTRCEYKAPKA